MKPQHVVAATSLGAAAIVGIAGLSLVRDLPTLRYLLLTVPRPMPTTLLLVGFACIALALTRFRPRWPAATAATVVWSGGLAILLLYVADRAAVAQWVVRRVLTGHLPSPHSGVALSLLGIAIMLAAQRRRVAVRIGHALAVIAMSSSSLIVLAYLFGARELYTVSAGIGMSPLVGGALVLLSFGALSVTPRFSLARVFYAGSAGGRMARRFVPFVVGVPMFAAAAIASCFRRGWFTAEAGMALFALGVMMVLGGITWWYALGINIAESRLERLVRSRTRKLTETISELEEFSQALAHDVRGPLINLREFLRIIRHEQENNLEPEGRDYLERAMRASERLDRLTSAMLRYGELSRRPFRLMTVDPEPLVLALAEEVRTTLCPAATVQVQGPFAQVWADEAGLGDVIRELIRNACRFTRPGAVPHLTLGCESLSSMVRLFVTDQGMGVKAQFHERIFHPFEQLARATEHTGIGLALVRRAITKMNGRVGVISDGERGSTFWVELPRPQSRAAVEA